MLEFQSLHTGYGQKVVGRSLCGTLRRGTLTALLGSNGAGKSTLLRTLAGLQPALSGQVRWSEREIKEYAPRELARMLSVVLTFRPEAEALTAEEVVEMGRIPYGNAWGGRNEADAEQVNRALALTETEAFRHRPISTLSDGERQRIFIAKALAQDTPAILLDEPTAFLDFPSKVSLLRLLVRLSHEEGKTILFSTHDVELALQFADQLWLLNPDAVVAGTPNALAANGTLKSFFAKDDLQFDAETMRFTYGVN